MSTEWGPLQSTAIEFIQIAPSCLNFFQNCSPVGSLYVTGLYTAEEFEIGKYSLKTDTRLITFTQLTDTQLKYFNVIYEGEEIFNVPTTEFIGYKWEVLIGLINKKIYKICASMELGKEKDNIELTIHIISYLEVMLGTPSSEDNGYWEWNFNDGNILLERQEFMEKDMLVFVITSSSVKKAHIK